MKSRARRLGKTSRKLSQEHRAKISKALKEHHAKKRGRRANNDNKPGSVTKQIRESFKSRRTPVYENRGLEARHLRDLRRTNRALKQALTTKKQSDAHRAIKTQKGFKRRSKFRSLLSKILPKNLNRT